MNKVIERNKAYFWVNWFNEKELSHFWGAIMFVSKNTYWTTWTKDSSSRRLEVPKETISLYQQHLLAPVCSVKKCEQIIMEMEQYSTQVWRTNILFCRCLVTFCVEQSLSHVEGELDWVFSDVVAFASSVATKGIEKQTDSTYMETDT